MIQGIPISVYSATCTISWFRFTRSGRVFRPASRLRVSALRLFSDPSILPFGCRRHPSWCRFSRFGCYLHPICSPLSRSFPGRRPVTPDWTRRPGSKCRALRGASSVVFLPQYYPLPQKKTFPPQNRGNPALLNPGSRRGEISRRPYFHGKGTPFSRVGAKSLSRCPDMLGPPILGALNFPSVSGKL